MLATALDRLRSVVPAAFAAVVVSTGVVRGVRELALRRGLLDQPNERSSHTRPVPRLGGIGIVVGVLTGFAVAYAERIPLDRSAWWTILVFVAVALLGLVDDVRPLRSSVRLIAQLALATTYCLLAGPLRSIDIPGLGALQLGLFAFPASVLWIAWMINLFNFMDGLDGLAGTQALVAGVVFLAAGLLQHDLALASIAFSLAAASLGFLVFNFPPASIFMGDVGSTALGFAFGALTIRAASSSPPALEFPAAVLATGPFVFDGTFTLLRRMVAGERFWEAHRTHLYQRPQNWGVGHRRVTVWSSVVMVASGVAALAYQLYDSGTARLLLAGGALLFGGLLAGVILKHDANYRQVHQE